jgi:alkanesulfonate monooxygenase SsuD/methylene tetrahydromethanopterin reductase-like flavin-dependent oxidoreductase (luciferase family)
MKYGMSLPNFGWFGDINLLVEIAVEAEKAGWDGFYIWDHLLVFKKNPLPFVDPWVALSAIACNTKKIRIGTHITPLPRRRPWKLAREAVTLDHLSKGRFTLGVGIGEPPDPEFVAFGEEPSAKIRAEKLDEGLDIIIGLWSGKPISFSGKYFQLDEVTFLPKTYQKPRIPIWVGGGIPHKAPFSRAALYDGVAPVHSQWPTPVEVSHIQDVLAIIKEERGHLDNFDVVICGETSGTDSAKDEEKVTPWIEAGVTWWLEDIHGLRAEIDELRERIRAGPPAI